MMRFLLRAVGIWVLAAALVAAVVDGAKSIAASTLVMTPMSQAWLALQSMAGAPDADAASPVLPWGLDAALNWFMAAPLAAVLGGAGALLVLAGRRRRNFTISREFVA